MSRLVFFLQEALRALRRNGAPTLAAVVTTVVTVILLGVLIPIFQTTQAKSNQIRSELNVQFELYEGRVVRDEVSGGYTEESTTEFGLRMQAEMGVGAEGEGRTNGHGHDALI